MRNLSDVVVSPDGRFVYVLAENDSAITWFSRDPATGELTFEDCLSSSTNYQGDCHLTAYSTTGGALTGMGAPVALAISKDANGSNLYTASAYDSAVASFSRDPVTGAVSFLNCISGDDGISNCTTAPALDSFHTGMESTEDIAVSADGKSAYAVSSTDDTLIRLSRSPVDGSLGFVDYTQAPGVNWPQGVTVSPDDTSVYVAGSLDDAVVHFVRNPANGSVSFGSCVAGGTVPGCANLGTDGDNGLSTVWSLEVTPDGTALYAVTNDDHGLARFTRASNGTLTFNGCLSGEGDTSCTHIPGTTSDGQGSPAWFPEPLAISNDSQSVYLGGTYGSSVITFNRGTGSELSFGGCISSDPSLDGTCTLTPGASLNFADYELYDLAGIALSPDDSSLYTASGIPRTLTHFNRGGAVDTKIDGKASAAKTQKQRGHKIVVAVKVRAKEKLKAKATGSVKAKSRSYKLKPVSKSVSNGKKTTVKLKPKKSKDAKKIAKALKKGSKGKAKIKVVLSDAAGNSKKTRLAVKLKA